MKPNYSRALYIKTLQENTGKILMDKLFDKYCSYINYTTLNKIIGIDTGIIMLNDPFGAFFDTLCLKISQNCKGENTVLYQIMSPYHKKEVIYGLLVINNDCMLKKILNLPMCKPYQLYTVNFSNNDTKYLSFSNNIFKTSNKIQQE